jgi:hypothetical protein
MPARRDQDVELHQGTDRIISIIVYDEDDVARDLTDCDVRWVITRRYNDTIVLEEDGVVADGGGSVDVTLADTDTADLLGDYRSTSQRRGRAPDGHRAGRS